MTKTKRFFLALFTMLIAVFCFFGCDFSRNDSQSQDSLASDSVETLTLSEHEISIELYGSATLTVSYDGTDTIIWSSSDESVVTVTDGTLTPINIGTATVTATAGELSDSCAVTVVPATSQPELYTEYAALDNMKEGDEVELAATIYMGGKEAEGTIGYSSKDSSVATVSETGKVTAVSKGETEIVIEGSYKGQTLETLSVPVSVSEEVSVWLDGVSEGIVLYTVEKEGQPISVNITPKAMVGGREVENAEITVEIEDAEIASLSGSTVTAAIAGETTITLVYTSAKGTKVEKVYTLKVEKPVVAIQPATDIIYSLEKDQAAGPKVPNVVAEMGIEDEILKIWCDDIEIKFEISGENITFENFPKLGDVTWIVETAALKYSVPVCACTYKIGDQWHFANMSAALEKAASGQGQDYNKVNDTKNWYIAMYQDWTHTYSTHDGRLFGANFNFGVNTIGNDLLVFQGTFDGRGHAINNLAISTGFIANATNATIKDLKIVCNGGINGQSKSAGKNNRTGGLLGNCFTNVTVENVYIDCDWIATQTDAAAIVTMAFGCTFKNCVFKIDDCIAEADAQASDEAVKDLYLLNKNNQSQTIENVYFITSMFNGQLNPIDGNANVYTDAFQFFTAVESLPENMGSFELKEDGLYYNGALVLGIPEIELELAGEAKKIVVYGEDGTKEVSLSLKIGGTTVSTSDVEVVVEDETVATYADGVITAKKFGETTLTLSYEGKEKTYTVSVEPVPVQKEEVTLTPASTIYYTINRAENSGDRVKHNLVSALGIEGTIEKISCEGTEISFEYINDGSELAFTSFPKLGDVIWTVETSDTIYTVPVCAVTWLISTNQWDFSEIGQAMKVACANQGTDYNKENATKDWYIAMTVKISYTYYQSICLDGQFIFGGNMVDANNLNVFQGVFDGRGNALDVPAISTGFITNATNATIKNLKINCWTTGAKIGKNDYVGGVLGNVWNNVTVENVFIRMPWMSTQTDAACVVNMATNCTFKNCVFWIQDQTSGNETVKGLYLLNKNNAAQTVENVYFITNTFNGKLNPATETANVYSSCAEFFEKVTEFPEEMREAFDHQGNALYFFGEGSMTPNSTW